MRRQQSKLFACLPQHAFIEFAAKTKPVLLDHPVENGF